MKKGMKYLALFLVIALLGLFVFRIFSPIETTPIEGANMDGTENHWLTLFISWLPTIIIVVLYIVFLKYLKKLIGISEKIATSLEKISNSEKLKS
jgi:H+/gluconate symporter-like permease